MTHSFPELTEAFAKITEPLILDGEILAWNTDPSAEQQRALPFKSLQNRIGRKRVTAAMREQAPVVFMAFDLLYHGNRLLLDQPLAARRAALEEVYAAQAPHTIVQQHARADRVAKSGSALQSARCRTAAQRERLRPFRARLSDAPHQRPATGAGVCRCAGSRQRRGHAEGRCQRLSAGPPRSRMAQAEARAGHARCRRHRSRIRPREACGHSQRLHLRRARR